MIFKTPLFLQRFIRKFALFIYGSFKSRYDIRCPYCQKRSWNPKKYRNMFYEKHYLFILFIEDGKALLYPPNDVFIKYNDLIKMNSYRCGCKYDFEKHGRVVAKLSDKNKTARGRFIYSI